MESALTRVYRGGVLQKEGFGLADITNYLADTETLVWVDLRAPTKEQLEDLGIELGFHELAIEDALVGDQRPKLNRHDGHLFLSCQAVRGRSGEGATHRDRDRFVRGRSLAGYGSGKRRFQH